MSDGSAVATMPIPYNNAHGMSTSISSIASLPSARPHSSSAIAKSYRQAAQLFLTRRFPEALSTIEPIVTPQAEHFDHDQSQDEENPTASPPRAPIANASRGTRTKVWSFYLTFLNAVVELGPEEGKHAFGSTKWRALVAKARDGSIWEDVVRDGYGGVEGDVDADVVINLATLLLTHSQSQKLNQTRLETYLSSTAQPSFDSLNSHLSSSQSRQRRSPNPNGTSTPRDLNTRLKLLELFTLHVLPRNEEWEYAREFIMMSEVLDDERKEAFLQALHNLKDERQHSELREQELAQQQQEQLDRQRQEAEARREAEAKAEEERRRRDEENRRQSRQPKETPREKGRTRISPQNGGQGIPSTPAHSSRPPAKKAASPPPGIYKRAAALIGGVQALILSTADSLRNNPMAMLRTFLILLAFILAFGRRDLRERVRRIVRKVWDKIRRTVGMGVKVSYV